MANEGYFISKSTVHKLKLVKTQGHSIYLLSIVINIYVAGNENSHIRVYIRKSSFWSQS